MTKRVVLDTNVFISAFLGKGAPYRVFRNVVKGDFLNFISIQILEEVEDKLINKFKLPPLKVKEISGLIVFSSEIVYPKKRLKIVVEDPSDDKIIGCAIEADASFIISGDKHLLNLKEYEGIEIFSPGEFLSHN